MNRYLKQEIKAVFFAPAPIRKQEFLNSLSHPGISRLTFFRQQAGYIRRSFWLLSFLFLAGALLILRWDIIPVIGLSAISALLPFLSLLGISEINRSRSFHMAELEMSCKYNLGEVTLVRLFISGFVHLIILLMVLLFAKDHLEYGIIRAALYLVVPFLATSGLSLFAVNRLHTRDTFYVCGCIAGFTGIGSSFLLGTGSIFYKQELLLIWVLAFVLFTVLLFMETVKLIKRTEDMQWNLSLTD